MVRFLYCFFMLYVTHIVFLTVICADNVNNCLNVRLMCCDTEISLFAS